jgi:hypothetical protein
VRHPEAQTAELDQNTLKRIDAAWKSRHKDVIRIVLCLLAYCADGLVESFLSIQNSLV